MSTLRRFQVPVLAALIGALGAVISMGALSSGGQAQAAPEPRLTVTRTVTIPPAAFRPTKDDWDFSNGGAGLALDSIGTAFFTAPLHFEAPVVTIRKITLFALDNGPNSIIAVLYRTTPVDGLLQNMGAVTSVGSDDSVRSFTERGLTLRRVTGAYGPFLLLQLPGSYSAGYLFHGVRVTYAYEIAP